MNDEADDEAPDGGAMAELLRERHGVDPRVGLEISVEADARRPRVLATLDRPATGARARTRIAISIGFASGPKGGDRWPVTIDAADALVGQLVESDYAYRDLPTGDDVGFGDAIFVVRVEASYPDLEAAADQLLGRSS
jgi:hypothetical protein